MLSDVLKTKVDEIQPFMCESGWHREEVQHARDLIQTESVAMMIDGAIEGLEQMKVSIQQTLLDQTDSDALRAINLVSELRRYMNLEIGGEFAQELGELCFSIEQMIGQASTQRREMPLLMAINLVKQVQMIWSTGMEQLLLDRMVSSEETAQETEADNFYYYSEANEAVNNTLH
jgi:flagellin-specific chaperone FliS